MGGPRTASALVGLALVAAGCVPTTAGRELAATGGEPGRSASDAAGSTSPQEGGAALAAAAPNRVFVRVDDVIDDRELAALAAIDGTASVSSRRGDDLALFSSTRSDGTPVDQLPPEFKVSLAAVVEDPSLGLDIDLSPGEVALTTTALSFRDLDVGSTVVLADGAPSRVVAILDDPALDDVEVVVDAAHADQMGLRPRQRALLRLGPGAVADDVADAAVDLLGEGAVTRVRVPDDRPIVLSLPRTKELFGEFAFRDLPGRDIQQRPSFTSEHITRREVPFFGRITCHEAIFEPLIAALQRIREEGRGGEIIPELYGGCWAPRRINDDANLSRHAWGVAIDINVDLDAPGMGPVPSDGFVRAFEENGFRWGGDYPVPDNHHFEYVGEG